MTTMADAPLIPPQSGSGAPPKPPAPKPPPAPPKPPLAPPKAPSTGAGALRVSLIPSEIAEQAKTDPRRWLAIIGLVVAVELVLFGVGYALLRSVAARRMATLESIRSQIQATDKQISDMSSSVNDLALYSIRSSVVAKTLDQHVYATRVFRLIERNTIPAVRYGSAAIDLEKGTIALSATALKYRDIVRQIMAFRATSDIVAVGISAADAVGDDYGNVSSVKFNIPLRYAAAAARFRQGDMPAAPEQVVDCGTDKTWSEMMQCLDNKFKTCSPTTADGEEGTAKTHYEVLGEVKGFCEIRFRYVVNDNKDIALKNADCRLDMSKPFHEAFADALAEDFASCSGQLPVILRQLKEAKK